MDPADLNLPDLGTIVLIALILLGIAFMVAEAFLPSFGVLGIGGVAAFVAGAVILIDTEVPGFGIPLSLIVPLGMVSALLVFGIFAMALKARRQRLVGGDSELIGSFTVGQSILLGNEPGMVMVNHALKKTNLSTLVTCQLFRGWLRDYSTAQQQ